MLYVDELLDALDPEFKDKVEGSEDVISQAIANIEALREKVERLEIAIEFRDLGVN